MWVPKILKIIQFVCFQKHKMRPGHFAVVFGSGSGACQDGGLPAFISEKSTLLK